MKIGHKFDCYANIASIYGNCVDRQIFVDLHDLLYWLTIPEVFMFASIRKSIKTDLQFL